MSRRDVKAGTGLHGLELSGASVNEIENSSVLGSGDSVHMAGRNRGCLGREQRLGSHAQREGGPGEAISSRALI